MSSSVRALIRHDGRAPVRLFSGDEDDVLQWGSDGGFRAFPVKIQMRKKKRVCVQGFVPAVEKNTRGELCKKK